MVIAGNGEDQDLAPVDEEAKAGMNIQRWIKFPQQDGKLHNPIPNVSPDPSPEPEPDSPETEPYPNPNLSPETELNQPFRPSPTTQPKSDSPFRSSIPDRPALEFIAEYGDTDTKYDSPFRSPIPDRPALEFIAEYGDSDTDTDSQSLIDPRARDPATLRVTNSFPSPLPPETEKKLYFSATALRIKRRFDEALKAFLELAEIMKKCNKKLQASLYFIEAGRCAEKIQGSVWAIRYLRMAYELLEDIGEPNFLYEKCKLKILMEG